MLVRKSLKNGLLEEPAPGGPADWNGIVPLQFITLTADLPRHRRTPGIYAPKCHTHWSHSGYRTDCTAARKRLARNLCRADPCPGRRPACCNFHNRGM